MTKKAILLNKARQYGIYLAKIPRSSCENS